MIVSQSGSNFSGVGFAVPVDIVNQVAPELIQFGRVQRAVLGVSVFQDSIARRLGIRAGALVQDVGEDSGAAAAGIEPTFVDENGDIQLGDVIVEIDGRAIRSFGDIAKTLDGRKPGERVAVVVERREKRISLSVELQAASTQN